ncbi:aminotransferase class V-fold PLP-dependent enzyme [Herbiconiux daphne]|uniref:Aminotransferase class V-fold PLP-dependent enzyme n=1 Tax=Herbiconiux daphne TaxID=2970914 RepID=A0ABT2H3X9_9MICO|nr:aminotransferase class V-fold PLP-dependent enzyme [Herbiconiux daphne]MCS5734639.1 aminotransferase class V-fold PLP-dependent enzyme [Herbiconiux daphne]
MALADYLDAFSEDPLYLNHASYGPPSRAVTDTVQRLFAIAAKGGPAASATLHSEDGRARTAVGALARIPAERIALTTSTSQGLMQLAFGVSGEVLVSLDEFPANLVPWRRAADAGRVRVRPLPGSGAGSDAVSPVMVTPERVADALTPATRVVSVSAVDFRTGYRADLWGIRDVIGPDRLLVVDGIQGFGAIDADWSPADAVVVGGQKWLRAGWGTGFIGFSERGLQAFAPTLSGWSAVEDAALYDGAEHALLPGAERFSVTNLSPFTSGALAAAAELASSVGVAAIEARIEGMASALIDTLDAAGILVLSPRPAESRAGIVVAGFGAGGAAAVHARLTAAGVTCTLHADDRIRFAVHATTTLEAVETAGRVVGAGGVGAGAVG